MEIKKIILGGVLLGSLVPAVSMASPQKHTSCAVQILQPKNSSGVYMNSDCKTAYVLPPAKGDFSLNTYNPTIPDTVCESIDLVEKRNKNMLSYETHISNAIARKSKELDELDVMIEEGNLPDGVTKEELLDDISVLFKEIGEYNDNLNKSFTSYIERKGVYAVMEGGVGNFSFTSGYAQLIGDFVAMNEGKGVNFVRMPLKKSRISVVDRRFDTEKNKVEMKAVKRMMMAAGPAGDVEVPLLNTSEGLMQKEKATDTTGVQEAVFGDGISGQIELSALGACAVKRSVSENPNVDPMKSYISAGGVYDYELMVSRNYSVTYNFKELVSIIRESTRRGGFFSRKTVNKLIDTRTTTSWINIHTESDDGEFTYTDEEIKEIKREFMDRALRQIVDIRTGGKASALALIDVSGKNGSQAIGDELQKCPHLYCQIGAAGFRILGAIFGSTSATSEVRKELQGDVRETRRDITPVTFAGSSTF